MNKIFSLHPLRHSYRFLITLRYIRNDTLFCVGVGGGYAAAHSPPSFAVIPNAVRNPAQRTRGLRVKPAMTAFFNPINPVNLLILKILIQTKCKKDVPLQKIFYT